MKYALLIISILVPIGAGAQSEPTPTGVPGPGLAAEAASRWRDALTIYGEALAKDPQRASLWLRVADIHARLGEREACVRALTAAAAAAPLDPSVHVRLSEAHAESGNADEALAAIERAFALDPSSVDYLQRRARLSAWAGAYERARDSYSRLMSLSSAGGEATIGLARASAWAGDTDTAVVMYRRYLREHEGDRDAWIELARAESWRGNFAEALEVLDQYLVRFGDSPEYVGERAGVLARAGRPRQAMQLIDHVLPRMPDDFALNVSRAVALAGQQRRSQALIAFEELERLRPGQPETQDARSLVRVAVASTGEPRAFAYSDSDGLRIGRVEPRVNVALWGDTRLRGGYDLAELRARSGSGLEQDDGSLDARHQTVWVGFEQPVGRVRFMGQGGYAWLTHDNRFTYRIGARVASDSFQLSFARDDGYLVISPRTVGLELTRLTHSARADWMPSLRYHLSFEGAYEDLSDGNRRWDVSFTPRRSIARTQSLNFDLGVQLRNFGATRNFDHGYYDPSRYESYQLAAFPYWKISQNSGLAAVLMIGPQRDDQSPSFHVGGNAAVESTIGIYQDWMLKASASYTHNDRLQSGAFRGYGAGVVLVRRF